VSVQVTPISSTLALEPRAPALTGIHGMPAQLTSFVGREHEIAAVRAALGSTRLLSLTGAGGSGKTRLALEVIRREARSTSTEGVWVELAPVHDPSLIARAVLAAIGIRDESDCPPTDRLVRVIGERPFLLVLDNCEHLVDACATFADTLLRASPALRMLVTSREALGVTGEKAWLVPPLSLPQPGAARLCESEAVQLFLQRARAVSPRFELTDDNRDAVAQICRRLDGLPLALELAAARLRVLSPHQIAGRLDDRFRLLTTGNRAAIPRHQTLRAAIDWSFELLDQRERLLLARLSVFGDSFTLDAAEAVCARDPIAAEHVLDLVSQLVEKSLVEMAEGGDVARYRLLETVREYSAARLEELGETEAQRRCHAAFFAALVREAEPYLTTRERPHWLARLEPELANIRQALAWTRASDPELHLRFVGQLHWFWFATGQWPEAREWLGGALALPNAAGRTRTRAMLLFSMGAIAGMQARADARSYLIEAESIAGEVGDDRLLAYVRNFLGVSLAQLGDPAAEIPAQKALGWFREANDLYGLRLSLIQLGGAHFSRGDLARAIETTEDAVRVARMFGLGRELAIALQQLAMPVLRSGDVRRATTLLAESLHALRSDGQVFFLARSLEMMASCAAERGGSSAVDGARLCGAAEAIRDSVGATMWLLDRQQLEPRIASAEREIGADAFAAARAEGRTLAPDDAIALALDVAARIGVLEEPDPSTNTAEYEVVLTPTADQAPAAPALRVLALGPLEIAVDGEPVPNKRWGYAKARELLVYLLTYLEGGGRTREQVGAALWPEASATQVRNNFHVTLHHLRRALGRADWVRFERDRYRIASPGTIDFDAAAFESHVTSALRSRSTGMLAASELRDALALYRGDLLDGEKVEDWYLELRDRLARLYAAGLETLGNLLLSQKQHDEAARCFEELLRKEELHEAASRSLMLARARSGDRAGALREYRRLEAVLDRELGSAPEPATRDLARRVRGEIDV
jgi:predicted ATPase/DNA-binding SARP family transcriptional activator